MANTINPWAAGAVAFNTRPWEAFYERQALRQQAKNDAMENYFRDLGKNVTSAGMRHQDVPGLLQKNQEWQDFYQQNKSAILNPKVDNGAAYSEYMHRYQDQMAHINDSKEALKTMDEVGKLKLNPQMSYVFDDPEFINQVQKHELPINDPNRQAISLATLAMPDKPIDTKEREAYQKYLTGGLKPDAVAGLPINLGGFKTQTQITHQFGDDNLRVIGQRAMDAYDTDRKWRNDANNIFKDIMHDPQKYDQLNTLYKSIFKNDIDNPREARAAADMLANKVHNVEYKPGEDKYGMAKAMAELQHGYRMSEIEAREKLKKKSVSEQDDIIEQLYHTMKDDARKSPVEYKTGGGKQFTQYETKASEGVKKMFAVPDGKGHLIYPDAIRYSDDFKTITPIFLEHYTQKRTGERLPDVVIDKNTGKSKVIKELSTPILEKEFKQRYKRQLMGTSAYGKTLFRPEGEGGEETNNTDPLGIF